jgi:hypothetical protein
MVLKMLAPNGVTSIYGDLIVSFKCDSEAIDIAMMNTCNDASAVLVTEVAKVATSELTISEQRPRHCPGHHAIDKEGSPGRP